MSSQRPIEMAVGDVTVRDTANTVELSNGDPGYSYEELGRLEHRAAIAVFRAGPVNGAALKCARKTLGLRQPELAEKLGVTTETICRWETGKEAFRPMVPLAMLALLIEAHGTSDTEGTEICA